MISPYTDHPQEALLAAQTGVAGVSTVLFFLGKKDRLRAWVLVAVVWLCALLPIVPPLLAAVFPKASWPAQAVFEATYVPIELALAFVSLRAGRRSRVVLSLLSVAAITALVRYMQQSDWE